MNSETLSAIYRYTLFFIFFFNDTATTEIYTLSLHDALPICLPGGGERECHPHGHDHRQQHGPSEPGLDRVLARRVAAQHRNGPAQRRPVFVQGVWSGISATTACSATPRFPPRPPSA